MRLGWRKMSLMPIPSVVLYVAISLGLAALALITYKLASEEAFIPMF
jgi:hypothetical protein